MRLPPLRSAALVGVLALGVGLSQGPTPAFADLDKAALTEALETLEQDERRACAAAIDTLAEAKPKQILKPLAEFAVTTKHLPLTVKAGKLLAEGGAKPVLAQCDRLLKKYKRHPGRMLRVVHVAEQVPGDAGDAYLERLAAHPNKSVAAQAVRSLAARDVSAVRGKLEGLLGSSRPEVAAASAYALASMAPDADTREQLMHRVENGGSDRIGDHAALALSRIEGSEEQAVRALEVLPRKTRSDAFHGLVKIALRSADVVDTGTALQLLKANDDRLREVACDLVGLRKLSDPAVDRSLVRLATGERDWRVRVAAWLALRRTGAVHVRDHVESAIASAHESNAEQSYWGIQVAGANPHEDYVEALRGAALDTDDAVRAELAARALRHHPGKDASREEFLETFRKAPGSKTGAAALLALGNLKDEPSFLALVEELRADHPKSVKRAIVKGLERLSGHFYEPDAEIWMDWHKVMDGNVAFEPKPVSRAKNRERVRKVQSMGVTPAAEQAVEQGLVWLSHHQDADGAWNGSTYHDHCPDGECRSQGGHRDRDLAYTALALLSFQGAGYTHQEGPYRDVMQRGFEYLMAHQDYDGSHIEKQWTFSYEAAVVCQALCDGYALTGDEWLGGAAQRMIDYVTKIQHPARTWRYRVRSGETDTSVMSWILMACVSAHKAGLDVPDQIFVNSAVWLDGASEPLPEDTYEVFVPAHFDPDNTYGIDITLDPYGKPRTYKMKVWYQPPRLFTPAMCAIGVLCRIWMGWTRAHPAVIGHANALMDTIPGYEGGLEKEYAFYPYTWYYGSLATYQMGGKYWSKWRKQCIDDLIANQQKEGHREGSWLMPKSQFFAGLTGGDMYCTTMAILTLETFYRYQPYLARAPVRADTDGDAQEDE